MAYYAERFSAEERMDKRGLLINYKYGARSASAFVSWLIQHDFEILPKDEFFVPA